MNWIGSLVQRQPLVSFFALTYTLCWGLGALLKGTPVIAPDGLFVGGILLAALLVTAINDGRAGLLDLGRRLVHWRVSLHWYITVFVLPTVIAGSAVALMAVFGVSLEWSERPALAPTIVLLLILIFLPFGAPFAEEVGWRGFALPRLLAQQSAFSASLILGVVWSLWHIPVVLSDPSLRVPVPFLLAVPSLSVLFTWLALHTGGSVLLAVLFHAWYDVLLAFVAAMISEADYALMWWLLFAVQSVAAAVVVLVARKTDRMAWSFTRPYEDVTAAP